MGCKVAVAMDGAGLFSANDFLWKENRRLSEENRLLREQLHQREDSSPLVAELERRCAKLSKDNARWEKRVAELSQKLSVKPRQPLPAFVKPNRQSKRRKRPGRQVGHPAALRPKPGSIDVHQQVPLPIDTLGQISCPECKTQLSHVKHHERIVEDLIPAKTITTCYHTISGYCPCCRRVIEGRGLMRLCANANP